MKPTKKAGTGKSTSSPISTIFKDAVVKKVC